MNILNICPFYTYPPDNGGKTRIYKINELLSKKYEKYKIFQFSYNLFRYLGKLRLHSWKSRINKNYVEYCYSPFWGIAFSALMHNLNILPLAYLNELMAFRIPSILKKKIDSSDLIQIEEPWQFGWTYKKVRGKKKIIADSQNIEYVLAKAHKPSFNKKILEKIFNLEKDYANKSDLLFCASKEDASKFQELYNIPKEKIKIIPNGVDISEFKEVSECEKEKLKKSTGFGGKKVVFFIGGVHYPNQEALSFIKKMASKMRNKKIVFLVAGTISNNEKNTKNIYYTGGGTHYEMIKYFKMADIALNPIFSGSGTNVKLLQYLSSGIPTITTKFGARGLELSNKKGLIIKETITEFCNAIYDIIDNPSLQEQLKKYSRKLIIGKYDFETITKKVVKCYEEVLE
jgi:glycosyltransferase involved in cell wall biosynthesis